MKAKLTKVLSLGLVVIMALSLMTGCSTSSSGKGTKTQDGNKVLLGQPRLHLSGCVQPPGALRRVPAGVPEPRYYRC